MESPKTMFKIEDSNVHAQANGLSESKIRDIQEQVINKIIEYIKNPDVESEMVEQLLINLQIPQDDLFLSA